MPYSQVAGLYIKKTMQISNFYNTRRIRSQFAGARCAGRGALPIRHWHQSKTPASRSVAIAISKGQWRRQKEEVGWALASVKQPNTEGVRSEAPWGRAAAGAETSAEGARVEAP